MAAPPQPTAAPAGSLAGRLARRLADLLVPGENPAAAIYGLIVIGALLAAESGQHESYLDTLLSAAIATALYWFAHSYAGVLGARLRTRRRLTTGDLAGALGHDAALIRGAAIPLLALAGAAIAGASQATAVSVGMWSSIASLVAIELLAAVRSGASRAELVLETTVGVTMGIAILALKIVLH